MSDEIRDSIQENHNQRKLNILKGFSDLDNFFEKAVYADNAYNQKMGRVGKTYGGAKEEVKKPTEKKQSDDVHTDKKTSQYDPVKIKEHLSVTSAETLKKFVANKDSDPHLVEFAKKELEDRGKDEESEKKEAAKPKPKPKKPKNEEGDMVTYKKPHVAGNKAKGKIVSVDKDGKYCHVRTSSGDLDYVKMSDIMENSTLKDK